MDLGICDTGFYELTQGIVPAHSHPVEHELIIFKGNGRLFNLGNLSYAELKDRIFWVGPHQTHGMSFPPGIVEGSATPTSFLWITFNVYNPEIERGLKEAFTNGYKNASSKTYKLLNDIYLKFVANSDNMNKSMNHQFLSMLYEMFESNLDTSDSPEGDTRILEAIRIMKARLYQTLDLELLAADLNLNKNYFFTLFKKKTGRSPMEYYMDLKIVETSKYLLNTDMKLSELPALFKFYNLSHFSRLFKKKYGKSPLAFRK